MCRRVEDLALITPIISGPDFHDAACAPVPWADPAKVELKKLKVAFCVDNGGTGTDEDTKKTLRQTAKWLEGVVAAVDEEVPLDILMDVTAARRDITSGDAWAFYKRLADKWGTHNFSPSVTERMKTMKPLSSAELVAAWEKADNAKSRMINWMQSYDVFLCPVFSQSAQAIDVDHSDAGVIRDGGGWTYRGVFNSTGLPVVVVRCGSSADGKLPIGVQVVAAPWREDIALAVASYLEGKSGGWKKPPI
jgi:amidase